MRVRTPRPRAGLRCPGPWAVARFTHFPGEAPPLGRGDTADRVQRRRWSDHAPFPLASRDRVRSRTARERAGGYRTGVVSILVVERDPVVRRGLASFAAAGASAVVEVADHHLALEEMASETEVVLAGVAPDDAAALALAGGAPAPGLLLVAPRLSDALVREVFGAGAKGLLLRESVADQLTDAIRVVAQGGTWADPFVAAVLTELSGKGRPHGTDDRGLTVQERRVLRLLPHQLTNREIAVELGVSTDTVKTHLRNAMAKLGAHDRIEAARITEREGIR